MPGGQVKIILTFDDGPRGTYKNILKVLGNRAHSLDGKTRAIRAAFFLQNCLLGKSRAGYEKTAAFKRGAATVEAGHYVAIHTGGLGDHTCHRVRVQKPFEAPDYTEKPTKGLTALDSDMDRAKKTLSVLTGQPTKYVRAVHGHTNQAVLDAYRRQNLENVHWHVDSQDSHGLDAGGVVAALKASTKGMILRDTIVFLFHDSARTSKNLNRYLDAIEEILKENGRIAVYPADLGELEAGLRTAIGQGEIGTCKHKEKPQP